MDVGAVVKRLGALKSERQRMEQHWSDCYRYGCPERAHGFAGAEPDREQQRSELYDSTAASSVQLLVSSIMSGTTPPSSVWFKAVPAGHDDDETTDNTGERWLESATNFIWRNIHASNFDSEAYEATTDGVVAGWLVLYIDTDRTRGGYVFEAWPIGSCWIASTRTDQRPDVIYREYSMTALQCVTEYGDSCSSRVRDLAAKEPDAQVKLLRVIQPRTGAKGGDMAKNLPFESLHIELDSKTLLRESGYHEFPCAVARWRRVPGSVYATGQMSIALPDAKTANKLVEQTLQHGDLAIAGMWIAEDDGVLNPATVKIGPRRVITANSVNSMKALAPASNFQLAENLLDSLRQAIRRSLMSDQLQPADGPAMTATEVHVRVDLIRQQLGPVYGRWQSEYLIPIVERCFGLALRAGVLGQPPEELQGQDMQIKFLSPLARAQKLEDVSAIERYMAGLSNMLQISPEVLDNVDLDAAAQLYGKGLGVPTQVMRSADDRAAYRDQRAQAAQDAQQQQQAMQLQQQAGQAAIDTMAKNAQVTP